LRYDPCFPTYNPITDPKGNECIEQIRLIAQPVSSNRPTGEDTAMHLLYSVNGFDPLTKQPRKGLFLKDHAPSPILRELLRLKATASIALGIDTNKTKMGVHPLITIPAFAAAVTGFILRNLDATKLMNVTYMGLKGSSAQDWVFFGGRVTPAAVDPIAWTATAPGSWTTTRQEATPNDDFISFNPLAPGSYSASIPSVTTPHPLKDGKDDPDTLATLLDTLRMVTPAQADRAMNFSMDPVRTLPTKGDCVSCHVTGLRRVRLGPYDRPSEQFQVHHVTDGRPSENQFPFSLAQMGGSGALVSEVSRQLDGLTAFVEAANLPEAGDRTSSWNTRNFGYFGGKATVSEATALSARAVAAFTNQHLGFKPEENPGLRCSMGFWAMNECLTFGEGTFAACKAQAGCE
jgi:hypothetical protein